MPRLRRPGAQARPRAAFAKVLCERCFLAKHLFILVFLLVPASAQAAVDESLAETARGQFERGIQLANQGDYQGALQAFTDAYATRPHFAVLYNIGQAQVALGRPLEAAATLSRYLREGQDEVSPERRRHVEDQIKLLESFLVELDVATDPTGATIHVDGRPVGRTPLAKAIRLSTGMHKLRVVPEPGSAVEPSFASSEGASPEVAPPAGDSSKAASTETKATSRGRLGGTAGSATAPSLGLDAQPRAQVDPIPVSSGWRRALPYALAGTGIALGAGALGVYLWKRGEYERWQAGEVALQSETPGSADYQARAAENQRLADSLATANRTILGLGIAGGALVAAGGSLLLLDRMSGRQSATFALAWGGGSGVTAGCWYSW